MLIYCVYEICNGFQYSIKKLDWIRFQLFAFETRMLLQINRHYVYRHIYTLIIGFNGHNLVLTRCKQFIDEMWFLLMIFLVLYVYVILVKKKTQYE